MMLLKLDNLSVGYGEFIAVENLDLSVSKGKILALIGPNGAGKTSTIMAIAGHAEVKSGRVLYEDQDITHIPPYERVKLGIALAPEGRKLFFDLTVYENLVIGNYIFPKNKEKEKMEFVFELFPRLKERINQIAGTLSGGEQQMLSIGRALMAEPKFLMIDEVSLGLMPKAVSICYEAIKKLKNLGVTILIVEQNTTKALQVADHVVVLESGRKVWEGSREDAMTDSSLIEAYLGLKKGEL
nr:ABC transporter ATP-binding protein [Deferribacter desulfuricans]